MKSYWKKMLLLLKIPRGKQIVDKFVSFDVQIIWLVCWMLSSNS